jgi:hypothetical protein
MKKGMAWTRCVAHEADVVMHDTSLDDCAQDASLFARSCAARIDQLKAHISTVSIMLKSPNRL